MFLIHFLQSLILATNGTNPFLSNLKKNTNPIDYEENNCRTSNCFVTKEPTTNKMDVSFSKLDTYNFNKKDDLFCPNEKTKLSNEFDDLNISSKKDTVHSQDHVLKDEFKRNFFIPIKPSFITKKSKIDEDKGIDVLGVKKIDLDENESIQSSSKSELDRIFKKNGIEAEDKYKKEVREILDRNLAIRNFYQPRNRIKCISSKTHSLNTKNHISNAKNSYCDKFPNESYYYTLNKKSDTNLAKFQDPRFMQWREPCTCNTNEYKHKQQCILKQDINTKTDIQSSLKGCSLVNKDMVATLHTFEDKDSIENIKFSIENPFLEENQDNLNSFLKDALFHIKKTISLNIFSSSSKNIIDLKYGIIYNISVEKIDCMNNFLFKMCNLPHFINNSLISWLSDSLQIKSLINTENMIKIYDLLLKAKSPKRPISKDEIYRIICPETVCYDIFGNFSDQEAQIIKKILIDNQEFDVFLIEKSYIDVIACLFIIQNIEKTCSEDFIVFIINKILVYNNRSFITKECILFMLDLIKKIKKKLINYMEITFMSHMDINFSTKSQRFVDDVLNKIVRIHYCREKLHPYFLNDMGKIYDSILVINEMVNKNFHKSRHIEIFNLAIIAQIKVNRLRKEQVGVVDDLIIATQNLLSSVSYNNAVRIQTWLTDSKNTLIEITDQELDDIYLVLLGTQYPRLPFSEENTIIAMKWFNRPLKRTIIYPSIYDNEI